MTAQRIIFTSTTSTIPPIWQTGSAPLSFLQPLCSFHSSLPPPLHLRPCPTSCPLSVSTLTPFPLSSYIAPMQSLLATAPPFPSILCPVDRNLKEQSFCTIFCADFCVDFCVDFCADFCVDFCVDFCADFCVDFCADFCADFCVDFRADFCADFCADFRVDFSRIFLHHRKTDQKKNPPKIHSRIFGGFSKNPKPAAQPASQPAQPSIQPIS